MDGIRTARARLGMTLDELSEASGVGASTISKIERGLTKPHPPTLGKLARALGMSVQELEALENPRARFLEQEAEHLDELHDLTKRLRKALSDEPVDPAEQAELARKVLGAVEEGLGSASEALHEAVRIERGAEKEAEQKRASDRLSELLRELPPVSA